MDDEKKKQFLFSLIGELNTKKNSCYGNDWEYLSNRISRCIDFEELYKKNPQIILDNYSPEYCKKNNFPNDIPMLPSELDFIINNIKKAGKYTHNFMQKTIVIDYILNHISDSSKISYIQSDYFLNNGYMEQGFGVRIIMSISQSRKADIYAGLPKKQEAEIKQKLGYLETGIISDLDKLNQSENKEDINYILKNLELKLSLRDIDIDLSSFYENNRAFNYTDLLETVFPPYYNSMDMDEKYDFLNCELSNLNGSKIHFDKYAIQSFDQDYRKATLNHFQIYNMIEDNVKHKLSPTNLLCGVLELNMISSDIEKLDILLQLEKKASFNSYYLQGYLQDIQNGVRNRLNVSIEQLKDILKAEQIPPKSKIVTGILSSLSPNMVKEYLNLRPNEFLECINTLTPNELNEYLKKIEDEEYKAKILMNINSEPETISSFFPQIEDYFVRCQIIISKTKNGRFESEIDTLQKISDFISLKKQFLELDENEKTSFLCNLSKSKDKINEPLSAHKERNEIKQSLLSYIENHDNRMQVIDSFEVFIFEENLLPYIELTNNMINEFFDDNCNLSLEEKERLAIALNSYDLGLKEYGNFSTSGRCESINKDISLTNSTRYDMLDVETIIINLLHEKAHGISNLDYIVSGKMIEKTFEEGMADTFAEVVANHYFQKHKEIKIFGNTFAPKKPLISKSSYNFENGWVKSMLYPLENSNQDKKAIKEFYLGDKKLFFDLCMGKDFSKKFKQNYLGLPLGVFVNEHQLLDVHKDSYINLNENSLYMIKNERIRHLSEKANLINLQNSIENTLIQQEITSEQFKATANAFNLEIKEKEDKINDDFNRGD